MLHGGALLAEIGLVLRQSHAATTAGYAKVDRLALRALAQPWQGAGHDRAESGGGDYLAVRCAVRCALGFKLSDYPWLLSGLVSYLEAADAATVTVELAAAWARLPGDDARPSYLSKRLCVARGFARHLRAFETLTSSIGSMPGSKTPSAPGKTPGSAASHRMSSRSTRPG